MLRFQITKLSIADFIIKKNLFLTLWPAIFILDLFKGEIKDSAEYLFFLICQPLI